MGRAYRRTKREPGSTDPAAHSAPSLKKASSLRVTIVRQTVDDPSAWRDLVATLSDLLDIPAPKG